MIKFLTLKQDKEGVEY